MTTMFILSVHMFIFFLLCVLLGINCVQLTGLFSSGFVTEISSNQRKVSFFLNIRTQILIIMVKLLTFLKAYI